MLQEFLLSRLTPYQRIHALYMSLDKDSEDAHFYPWPLTVLNREHLADNKKQAKVWAAVLGVAGHCCTARTASCLWLCDHTCRCIPKCLPGAMQRGLLLRLLLLRKPDIYSRQTELILWASLCW